MVLCCLVKIIYSLRCYLEVVLNTYSYCTSNDDQHTWRCLPDFSLNKQGGVFIACTANKKIRSSTKNTCPKRVGYETRIIWPSTWPRISLSIRMNKPNKYVKAISFTICKLPVHAYFVRTHLGAKSIIPNKVCNQSHAVFSKFTAIKHICNVHR